MQITVVALLCHNLAPISAPVCHEEIVAKDEMPITACIMSQPAIARWKENSIYRGEQWIVQRFKCIPGDYVPRDAI